MTPTTTRNPWLAATTDEPESIQLNCRTLATIEDELRAAIRAGLVTPGFAVEARRAVADGIASGIVTPAPRYDAVSTPSGDDSGHASHDIRGADSKAGPFTG